MLMPAGSVLLREARGTDWPAIEELLATLDLPRQGVLAHLGRYRLATHDDALVGCAATEEYGAVALLRSVAVLPGLGRQRLGTRLVEAVLDAARRRGIVEAYLLTTHAAGYFRRFGFAPVARQAAPAALLASAEFRGACPASAELLRLRLAPPGP
jgi:N-acetylglutamate synthase-like GNAT family acetyltransferase